MTKVAATLLFCFTLSACTTKPVAPSTGHIKDTSQPTSSIPEPVQQSTSISPPKPTPKVETYSVTVYKVAVQSLLFALARDAKLNVDIHPGIEGEVTLNAINQTLPQILSRISKQVDMRYELNGSTLTVIPDTPFLRNYKVDYVNVARSTTSSNSIATQISTGTDAGTGGAGNNNSTTSVSDKSDNNFWSTLVQNIKDILRETDKTLPGSQSDSASDQAGAKAPAASPSPASSSLPTANSSRQSTFREAASVIANPENGIIAVRATGRQHEKIQEFLDLVLSSSKRQVLIEATVVEVQLSDQYQQGINWQSLRNFTRDPVTGVPNYNAGFNIGQTQTGSALSSSSTSPLPNNVSAPNSTSGLFSLQYANPASVIGNIAATIQLLESFGKVKVLSSPKISVLNNQTALLKVVDTSVYFTINVNNTPATTAGALPTSTYTSELHTVPVGFVMSVTPQIADTDEVTINVRPSISRIIGYVQDPNPALANAAVPVVSNVPIIQTREMESMLKISSGQVAVMGGLMQDSINNTKDSIPGLNRIPFVGAAFSNRNEKTTKTELVIFMRPIVVKDASINGDYKNFREFLHNSGPLNKEPYSETHPKSKAEPAKVDGS
ncbi:MAG TPA: type II and III secretion system protein [Burkholderiaceae bacterium]|jgi:general secretion pathway protein D